jgi:multiple sugar transport system substrate-binding protein
MTQITRRGFLGRSAAVAAGVAGIGTTLAACGSSSTSGGGQAAGGKSTLSVMIDNTDTELGPLMKVFEKAHNCTVKVSVFDQIKLNAALAAGSPPDLVRTVGATEMPNLIARGLVQNLDSYFATSTAFKASDLDPIIGVYRFNGTEQGKGSIYGIPSDYSQDNMIWFNKTLFDKAKVPYLSETTPISYAELLDLGKKLTGRSGGKTTIYGMDPTWNFVNQAHFAQMIAQQGGSLWNSDFTAADFTSPEARVALQWYVDFARAHTGVSPLDPSTLWDGPIYDAERMAIVTYGYWFNAELSSASDAGANAKVLPKTAGFAPAPQLGSTRVDACFTGSGAWIPAKSANKDLAFKFLEYWRGAGSQPAINHFKAGGGLPLCKSLRQHLPQTTSWDKDHYDTQINNLAHFSVLRFSRYANYAAMEATITANVQAAMQGKVSVDAAAGQLQSSVASIVTQGRNEIG